MLTVIVGKTVFYAITEYEMFCLFEYENHRVDSEWVNTAKTHRP